MRYQGHHIWTSGSLRREVIANEAMIFEPLLGSEADARREVAVSDPNAMALMRPTGHQRQFG